jgi:hypothetical protein
MALGMDHDEQALAIGVPNRYFAWFTMVPGVIESNGQPIPQGRDRFFKRDAVLFKVVGSLAVVPLDVHNNILHCNY